MGDIKNLTGKYMGKMLESEGSADGRDFKKYKLTFQIDEKQLNFKAFTPWTKKDGSEKKGVKPNELEEGNFYKIGYTEYEGKTPEGKDYVSKTVVSLFDAEEPTEKQLNLNQATKKESVSSSIKIPEDEAMQEVIAFYKENSDPNIKTVNHFIGTVLRTFNPEIVEPLVKVFNEKIAEEKVE